jgi:hypothetical protein
MANMQKGFEMLFRADAAIMHAGGSGDDPIKVLQCHSSRFPLRDSIRAAGTGLRWIFVPGPGFQNMARVRTVCVTRRD